MPITDSLETDSDDSSTAALSATTAFLYVCAAERPGDEDADAVEDDEEDDDEDEDEDEDDDEDEGEDEDDEDDPVDETDG